MSGRSLKLRVGLAVSAALLVLSAGIGSISAAEQKTADEILNALKPKGATRSLSGGAAQTAKSLSQEDQKFLDSLRTKRTRSLSAGDRDRVASIAKDKPSIDLEITFDYNSANISRKAQGAVAELGKALSNPALKGGVFMVAGHTDAKGGDEYNQSLSEKRADAIKRHLTEKFGIAAENLVTVGYGKSQLKNTGNPFAEENRRVQVVNMEGSREARN
jgi:outer membrane protein OmpA-like peptidoglycan-associated protein